MSKDFVYVDKDNIDALLKLSGGALKTLYLLLSYIEYDNEVAVFKSRKERMAKRIGVGARTIDAKLTELVKAKILDRTDIGVYLVNPYLFIKGSLKNAEKLREEHKHLKLQP